MADTCFRCDGAGTVHVGPSPHATRCMTCSSCHACLGQREHRLECFGCEPCPPCGGSGVLT